MRFFKKSIVGIDMNCSQMHFVEVTGNRKAPIIQNAGQVFLPEDIIQEGKVINQEKFKNALDELWRKSKIKSKEVVLGVSNTDVIMRFVTLPKMPPEKLLNLIKFQASDYMPVNIDDFELDYTIIGENINESGSTYNVLLVAARKSMLYEFINAFDITRSSIKDIKSSVLVMDKVIPESYMDIVSVVVNLSLETCNILIMNKNLPVFARTVVLKDNLHREIDKMYKAYFDEVVDRIASFVGEEIRTSISYFQSQNRSVTIDKIFLIGCACSNEHISKELRDYIGVNVEVIKPYENLYNDLSKQNKNINYDPTEYAVALSLALHGLEDL